MTRRTCIMDGCSEDGVIGSLLCSKHLAEKEAEKKKAREIYVSQIPPKKKRPF